MPLATFTDGEGASKIVGKGREQVGLKKIKKIPGTEGKSSGIGGEESPEGGGVGTLEDRMVQVADATSAVRAEATVPGDRGALPGPTLNGKCVAAQADPRQAALGAEGERGARVLEIEEGAKGGSPG